jgi:hypothetical protein
MQEDQARVVDATLSDRQILESTQFLQREAIPFLRTVLILDAVNLFHVYCHWLRFITRRTFIPLRRECEQQT